MKILFMGRKQVAANLLEWSLKKGHEVVGVLSDSHLEGSPTAKIASINNIKIYSLEDIYKLLKNKEIEFDLAISVLYWRKIAEPLISYPKFGVINLHPAPLPAFKGCAGYNIAILNKLKKWSITAHYVNQSIDEGRIIKENGMQLAKQVLTQIELMKVNEAIEIIFQFIRSVNKYLEIMAPWKLVKSDIKQAGKVLFTAAEALRLSSELLSPVMPNRTSIVIKTLGVQKTSLDWGGLNPGNAIKKHDVLFPRIDINKFEEKKTSEKKSQLVNIITFDQFKNIEFKTAKILEAEKVDGADKLLKLQVEIKDQKRIIVSGIAEFYSTTELIGRIVIIITNLKPATIFGIESQGMILAAKEGKVLRIITIDNQKVESGSKVY